MTFLQAGQEQSNLTQAKNKNDMAWTGFSGFQQARETKHNLLHQDEEECMSDSVAFDPSGTMDCFKNPDLVKWIKQIKKMIELKTNAGSKLNDTMAFAECCGEVLFDRDAQANVMALKNVKKTFKVKHDSEVWQFTVWIVISTQFE